MKLSKNIVISDKTVKIVDSKKYGGFVGLINKLQKDFAANGFADDSINYKIWAINTEANFPEQHMAYSHWDGILNEPVMSMQAITKVSNETVKMFADAFAANKSTRGYSMFLGGEIGTKVRALLGNCGIMLSNEYRLFIDNTDFYIGSFDIKRGIYFTDVFEIADNNPTWRMVSSYFYDKGIQFYSLGGAKWFGAFNRIEDFNEFWEKLGVYDIESFEPLTDKAKELFSANTEVAVEDDPSKPSEETYTILKRFDLLDREPKFYYMLLGRLQQDCNYLIDSSHSADTLWAHDIDDQINLMYALYDIVPEKPQWITIDEIAELEYKMKAATGETDEDEANLFDDYTGICLVSEDDGHEVIEVYAPSTDPTLAINELVINANEQRPFATVLATLCINENTREIWYDDNNIEHVEIGKNLNEIRKSIQRKRRSTGFLEELIDLTEESYPEFSRLYATVLYGTEIKPSESFLNGEYSFGEYEAQIDTAHSIFSLDVVNVEGDKESVVYMQGDEADDAIRAINKIYITEENITVEEAIGKWMNLYL